MEPNKRYYGKIYNELVKLEVGESFSKEDFIKQHWEYYDWFVTRSFDVAFVRAKQMIQERKFKSIDKRITRIS